MFHEKTAKKETLIIGEKWMLWGLILGVVKTGSQTFKKLAGSISGSLNHIFFISMIMGATQTVASFVIKKGQVRTFLSENRRDIAGAILIGIFALALRISHIWVFFLGGDVAILVLFTMLYIVPGALIDRVFFKNVLTKRQLLGVIVGIFAIYSILQYPSLKDIGTLPLWMLVAIGVMVLEAVNHGVTRGIKKIDPFALNFFGGLTTVIGSLLLIIFSGSLGLVFVISNVNLWLVSIILGLRLRVTRTHRHVKLN